MVARATANLSIFIIYALEACLCAPLRAALWPQRFLQLLWNINTSHANAY